MPGQKQYRTVVPVPVAPPHDDDALVWYMRESFDRAAAYDDATLIEFRDMGRIPSKEIPRQVQQTMGKPASAFVWRVFEGTARRA